MYFSAVGEMLVFEIEQYILMSEYLNEFYKLLTEHNFSNDPSLGRLSTVYEEKSQRIVFATMYALSFSKKNHRETYLNINTVLKMITIQAGVLIWEFINSLVPANCVSKSKFDAFETQSRKKNSTSHRSVELSSSAMLSNLANANVRKLTNFAKPANWLRKLLCENNNCRYLIGIASGMSANSSSDDVDIDFIDDWNAFHE